MTGVTVSMVPKETEHASLSWFAWDLPEVSIETLQSRQTRGASHPRNEQWMCLKVKGED